MSEEPVERRRKICDALARQLMISARHLPTIEEAFDAGADSEKRETVKAIVARIDSLTGPTGGWLDSPKRLKAEIEAEFGGSGTGGK